MDKLKSMVQDIKSGWEEMERAKRIQLISVVSVILILIGMITYFTQRTDYEVLFNDLEDADAGVIVEDLESKGMKYQLENNGSTILIDNDEIDNYRIELAVDGLLPSTSTGFEIFDGGSMMATDEDRAIMYQRAVSGELERAVESLDDVEDVQVILNIPEDSVFQNPEYRKDASASVVLDMKTNQPPTKQSIQGIASLVSGAIDNLPMENVKIVDTNGNLLSASLEAGTNDASVVNEHQQIKKSVEADLENKVMNLLGAIYGHDKVFVSVNTQLNFDAIEREEIEYNVPESSETDRGLIRSQQEQATGSSGISRVEGSTLDEDNVTEFAEDEEDGDNSSYDHTTNYELDSSTSHIIQAPGSVENVSASVVVTGQQGGANPELLVRNALGISPELDNGSVEIEFVQPSTEEEEAILSELTFLPNIMAWLTANWWMVLIGILLLIALIVVIRLVSSRRSDAAVMEEEKEPAEEITERSEVIEEVEPAEEVEEKVDEEESVEETSDEIDEEEREFSEEEYDEEMQAKIRQQEIVNEKEDLVRDEARESPELVAELIKIWLNENEKE